MGVIGLVLHGYAEFPQYVVGQVPPAKKEKLGLGGIVSFTGGGHWIEPLQAILCLYAKFQTFTHFDTAKAN